MLTQSQRMLSMSYQSAFNQGFIYPLLALGFGTLTACSQPASQQTSETKDTAQETKTANNEPTGKTYTVITQPDFVPFVFRGEDGKVTGFDMEVIQAIADNQGFSINVITLPQDTLIDNVMSGKYDILASSLSITEERKEKIAFSNPYFESRQTMLLSGNVPKVSSFKELEKYKIGVKENTTSDKLLKEVFPGSKNIKYVDTLFIGVRSVISGNLDGVISDSGVVQHYKQQNKDANIHLFADLNYPVEHYGFAVKKDRDDELLQQINTGLAEIKADGRYQKIVDNWFGEAQK